MASTIIGSTYSGSVVTHFGKKIWVGIFFGSNEILVENLVRKFFLVTKIWVGNFFESKNMLVGNFLGSKKYSVGIFLGNKKIGSEIFLGKKNVSRNYSGSKTFLVGDLF